MATYNEVVYMVFDELKITSDDSIWEQDHVIFLLNKYRSFLIKQRYSHTRKNVPSAYYQRLFVELTGYEPVELASVENTLVVHPDNLSLISRKTLPQLIDLNGIEMDTHFDDPRLNFVSIDRFHFTGTHNRFQKRLIYLSLDRDNRIRAKSEYQLPKNLIEIYAILENPQDIIDFNELSSAPIELEFPVEHALLQPIIELVIKELGSSNYLPEDDNNNAADDIAGLAVNS